MMNTDTNNTLQLYHLDGWWDTALSELMIRRAAFPVLMSPNDVHRSDCSFLMGGLTLVERLPCLILEERDVIYVGVFLLHMQPIIAYHISCSCYFAHTSPGRCHILFSQPTNQDKHGKIGIPGLACWACLTTNYNILPTLWRSHYQ